MNWPSPALCFLLWPLHGPDSPLLPCLPVKSSETQYVQVRLTRSPPASITMSGPSTLDSEEEKWYCRVCPFYWTASAISLGKLDLWHPVLHELYFPEHQVVDHATEFSIRYRLVICLYDRPSGAFHPVRQQSALSDTPCIISFVTISRNSKPGNTDWFIFYSSYVFFTGDYRGISKQIKS